jgi:uncharacterized membrane protein
LTVAGAWLVSHRREGEVRWRLIDVAFPLAAALLAAISQIIRKSGLALMPNPAFATAITTSTSLLVFSLTLLVTRRIASARPAREALPYYLAAAWPRCRSG